MVAKSTYKQIHRGIVDQIVGRCHVSRSNRYVIGYVASRFKGGRAVFLRMPKSLRRAIEELAIESHSDNRSLYNVVMRGF